jgi:hypothetical protein
VIDIRQPTGDPVRWPSTTIAPFFADQSLLTPDASYLAQILNGAFATFRRAEIGRRLADIAIIRASAFRGGQIEALVAEGVSRQ